MKRKLSEIEIAYIKNAIESKISECQTSKNLNCDYRIFKRLLIENEINYPFFPKGKVRHNPFEDLKNPEVMYWLGFLASDGCITDDRISLSLKRSDEDVLIKFKNFIGCDLTLFQGIHKKPFGDFEFSKISFRNKNVAEYLHSLGLVQRKTLVFKANFEITWDYLRGYFEGDGCLDFPRQFGRIQIVSASLCHLKQIQEFLIKNEINCAIYTKTKGHISIIHSLEINKKDLVYQFLENIYNNASVFMDRKHYNAKILRNKYCNTYQIRGTSVGNPEPSFIE